MTYAVSYKWIFLLTVFRGFKIRKSSKTYTSFTPIDAGPLFTCNTLPGGFLPDRVLLLVLLVLPCFSRLSRLSGWELRLNRIRFKFRHAQGFVTNDCVPSTPAHGAGAACRSSCQSYASVRIRRSCDACQSHDKWDSY